MSEQEVNKYIANAEGVGQNFMKKVREITRDCLPETGETISYGVIAITAGGKPFMYYGASKKHLGIYPVHHASEAMLEEMKPYHKTKSAAHFLYSKPLPEQLIKRLVMDLNQQIQ